MHSNHLILAGRALSIFLSHHTVQIHHAILCISLTRTDLSSFATEQYSCVGVVCVNAVTVV